MTCSTKYLDILSDILDKCHEEYHKVFGGVVIEIILEDEDHSALLGAAKRYNKTRLTPALIELRNFPVLALRTEILKNYISFPREDQTEFYNKLLLDFAYKLGIHFGLISTYTETLKGFFEGKDRELLVELLVYQDDLGSINYIIENINDAMKGVYPSDEESEENSNKKLQDPKSSLKWKGDKTDLAELVWAMAKSGRITDTSTGKDVTQKELAVQIITLLGLDSLDVANLMKGRYGTETKLTSYKAQDGKTFINELQKLLDKRVID